MCHYISFILSRYIYKFPCVKHPGHIDTNLSLCPDRHGHNYRLISPFLCRRHTQPLVDHRLSSSRRVRWISQRGWISTAPRRILAAVAMSGANRSTRSERFRRVALPSLALSNPTFDPSVPVPTPRGCHQLPGRVSNSRAPKPKGQICRSPPDLALPEPMAKRHCFTAWCEDSAASSALGRRVSRPPLFYSSALPLRLTSSSEPVEHIDVRRA